MSEHPSDQEAILNEHPSFTFVRSLSEPWRSHFPKSPAEARGWAPVIYVRALASRVLVVAQTRVECAWSAYCDAVPGYDHTSESEEVLRHGDKVPEAVARVLFPHFKDIPYAH